MTDTTSIAGSGLRRIGRESLRDQVRAEIRNAIFNGQFAPGERITIRALAAALGTSPTPVREALNQFVAEGTLELLPNGSVAVPDMSVERFREITEIRQALEGLAAARAAERVSTTECAALSNLLGSLQELAARKAWPAYLIRHREFHFQVYEAARMPMLSETIDSLWLRCGPVLTFVVPTYVARKRGAAHHAELVDALARGDGKGARDAVCADIGEATSYLLTLAREDGRIHAPDTTGQ